VNLAYENQQALALVQALWGVISPNFRSVSFECIGEAVRIYVILEHDDAADYEEIEDLVPEFEALQQKKIEVDIKTIVSAEPWKTGVSEILGRPVYVRREM
jgi:hypothetical protein